MATNILVCSVGSRNKIIQYFKRALAGRGKVVATDMSPLAPALYEADRYYIVPRITDERYVDCIVGICEKEHIAAVLSLIDPELSVLAWDKDRFADMDVTVIGSSYDLCEMSLDKWHMYQWLCDHGYKCARSYIDKDIFFADAEKGVIKYPVFVKPVKGSASIAISKAYDKETIEMLVSHAKEQLMIQEFLEGQEIGADVYIDMISQEVVSVFTKKKLVMRAGETDKAVSFKDEKLFQLIESFVTEAGFTGQIDMDLFEINGEYYISEVNPRFGGGYPHAYECGCDHMRMILENLAGRKNRKTIGTYEEGICMMKYNEIKMCGGNRFA